MKKFVLIVILFVSFSSLSQKYDAKKIKFSANTNIDSLERNEIYSLDKEELYRLISRSKKKYNLLVSFGTWCSPCRKSLPALIQFIEENSGQVNLYIVNIEKDSSQALLETQAFFSKINYSTPTFMVSENYGKTKKGKYKLFVKDIIGERDFSEIYLGMFEHILFDENVKIVYKSNYNDKDDITLQNINKIINSAQ